MVVFYKICYISHVNVGKMKILEMTKKLFQRPVFCKQLMYVTLISNHKVAISACFKNYKNYITYLQFTYTN